MKKIILLFFIIGIWFIFNWPLLGSYEDSCYTLLIVSYFLTISTVSYLTFNRKLSVFEPYFIVSVLFIFLYNISPMIYLIMHTSGIDDHYMLKGCYKGTIIYLLAFYSFTFGYYHIKYIPHTNIIQGSISSFENERISTLSLIFWFICFALSLIYYVFGTGLSLIYILTIGSMGDVSMAIDTPLKFLINFSWSMLPFWLIYVMTSKSNFIKAFVTILTLCIYIIGGTRFIVVLMFGALLWTYYIKNGKNIRFKDLLIPIILFLFFTTFMAQYRVAIRSGLGNKGVEIQDSPLYENFYTNTNIIFPYYCIVDKYPSKYPYFLGKGYFIEPIYYFVPRAIYPYKPGLDDADIVKAMRNSTGFDICGQYGMATPFLSEMYLEFGPIGVILLMFLIGMFLARYKLKYLNIQRSLYDIVEYCIIYFAIFQIFIRGYMSMNIFMLIFLILPIRYLRKKTVCNEEYINNRFVDSYA